MRDNHLACLTHVGTAIASLCDCSTVRLTQVVRSLSACQGALLLVDSTQGVQAQTLSTAKAAEAAGLKLVPVVTKIDLPHANVDVSDDPPGQWEGK